MESVKEAPKLVPKPTKRRVRKTKKVKDAKAEGFRDFTGAFDREVSYSTWEDIDPENQNDTIEPPTNRNLLKVKKKASKNLRAK